ncbi:MAG: hypothetical protein KJN75_05060 [Muriicola sp.]|nr:hypothetical protein [Muriicola sp.]
MAERLVILSDMWGTKNGLWITSYLGYLQQHFDIVFYDIQQLSNIDSYTLASDNKFKEFIDKGLDTAVEHLLKKESIPSHYLTFCSGGSIAWHAGLKGLPIKSLFAIAPKGLETVSGKLSCPTNLVFGEHHNGIPSKDWIEQMDSNSEVIPNFGEDLYSDEVIIQKVSLYLLESLIRKQFNLKRPLSIS